VENHYLSTPEVAEALGISVTTVKRWVDAGILPAHKTAGGHRKLFLADVLRVARAHQLPYRNPGRRGNPTAGNPPGSPDYLSGELFARLVGGDQEGVKSLVFNAYQSGMAATQLADEVIAPALGRIGHEWEKGQVDVMHEHRGVQLCEAALHEWKSLLDRSALASAPLAIGGAPEGDFYSLATLLAQIVLLDCGWQAINLGPNTPASAFRTALRELQPRLLWVSVGHVEDPSRLVRDYGRLCEEARSAGVAVVVGGRAVTEALRSVMSSANFGDGFSHLAALAHAFHAGPRRPRRGRPPKS
jgi:excisionase family DNA binding protein